MSPQVVSIEEPKEPSRQSAEPVKVSAPPRQNVHTLSQSTFSALLRFGTDLTKRALGVRAESHTNELRAKIQSLPDANRRLNEFLSVEAPEWNRRRTNYSVAIGLSTIAMPVLTGLFVDLTNNMHSLNGSQLFARVAGACFLVLPIMTEWIGKKDQLAFDRLSSSTVFSDRASLVKQFFNLSYKALKREDVSSELEASRSNGFRTFEFSMHKFQLIQSTATLTGAFFAIGYVNPWLAAGIAATAVPILRIELRKAGFVENFRNHAVKYHKRLWPSFFDKTSAEYVPQIKSMNMGSWAKERIYKLGHQITNHYFRMEQGVYKANIRSWAINSGTSLAAGAYILHQAFSGTITSGAAVQFLGSAFLLQRSLTEISNTVGQIQQCVPYVNRALGLAEIVKECGLDDESPFSAQEIDVLRDRLIREDFSIHLRDVVISHGADTEESTKKTILDIPDLKIGIGEYIGLVGEIGAGKSTLVETLQGFRKPESGKVLLCVGDDAYDIEDLPEDLLPQVVSYNQQDFYPGRSLNVLERIKLGVNSGFLLEEDLDNILEITGVDNFIERAELENVIIGEGIDPKRSRRLSGGEGQSVANAAALIGDYRILILDEPTSKQDSRQERKLFDNLKQRTENGTVILISHRFNTLKEADRIIVLNQGRIEDQGTHVELVQRCDVYRELYELQ